MGLFAEYGHTVQKTPCWMAGWIFLLKSNNSTLLKSKMVALSLGHNMMWSALLAIRPNVCPGVGKRLPLGLSNNTPSVGALNLRSNELDF